METHLKGNARIYQNPSIIRSQMYLLEYVILCFYIDHFVIFHGKSS